MPRFCASEVAQAIAARPLAFYAPLALSLYNTNSNTNTTPRSPSHSNTNTNANSTTNTTPRSPSHRSRSHSGCLECSATRWRDIERRSVRRHARRRVPRRRSAVRRPSRLASVAPPPLCLFSCARFCSLGTTLFTSRHPRACIGAEASRPDSACFYPLGLASNGPWLRVVASWIPTRFCGARCRTRPVVGPCCATLPNCHNRIYSGALARSVGLWQAAHHGFVAPLVAGIRLGGGGSDGCALEECAEQWGLRIGAAFQLLDDLQDLASDPLVCIYPPLIHP